MISLGQDAYVQSCVTALTTLLRTQYEPPACVRVDSRRTFPLMIPLLSADRLIEAL